MSVLAVCLCGINSAGAAVAEDINPHCDWFKVKRVNTLLVSTQVIESQPIGNLSDKKLVGESVSTGSNSRFLRDNERAISSVRSAGPFPATIVAREHIPPESVLKRTESRRGKWIAVSLPSHVVHAAHAATNAALSATVNKTELDRS
jgi:hypothetical protein